MKVKNCRSCNSQNIDKALVKGSNSDAFDLIIIFTDGTEKNVK